MRWSIVAEDGHREQGVLAFAVGAGGPTPFSILGSSAALSLTDVTLRALFLLGALTAAGVFAFWLLMRRLFVDELRGHVARLLFFGLFTAFVGAGGLVYTTTGGTRFALLVQVAAIVAAAGAAAAALAAAPRVPAPGRRSARRRPRGDPGVRRSCARPRLTAMARGSGRSAASRSRPPCGSAGC